MDIARFGRYLIASGGDDILLSRNRESFYNSDDPDLNRNFVIACAIDWGTGCIS